MSDLTTIRRAISDPGSVLKRESGYGVNGDEYESLPNWQARAVLAVIGDLSVTPRAAAARDSTGEAT